MTQISCRPDRPLIFCRKHQLSGKDVVRFQRLLSSAQGGVYETMPWRNLKQICCEQYGVKNMGTFRTLWLSQHGDSDPDDIRAWCGKYANQQRPEDFQPSCQGCLAVREFKKSSAATPALSIEHPKENLFRSDSAREELEVLAQRQHYPVGKKSESAQAILWTAMEERRLSKSHPLLWLLRQSRRLKCSDQRDKGVRSTWIVQRP